jgi:hypothetical protein
MTNLKIPTESCIGMVCLGFFCLFIATRAILSAIWRLLPLPVTGLHLDLCLALTAFSSEGSFFFYVPHLLRHGTSVYKVSPVSTAPTFHSEIRTRDARIIRSLHQCCSNQCITRYGSSYQSISLIWILNVFI